MSLHFSRHLLRRVFESSRFSALYLAAAIYLAISATTRLILSVPATSQGQIGASALLAVIPIGMLNISYDSVFFGKDVFKCNPKDRFVLLNHNRDIALFDGSKLTKLNFRKTGSTYLYDKPGNRQTKTKRDEEQVKNAASIYQSAYEFYLNQLYRWH